MPNIDEKHRLSTSFDSINCHQHSIFFDVHNVYLCFYVLFMSTKNLIYVGLYYIHFQCDMGWGGCIISYWAVSHSAVVHLMMNDKIGKPHECGSTFIILVVNAKSWWKHTFYQNSLIQLTFTNGYGPFVLICISLFTFTYIFMYIFVYVFVYFLSQTRMWKGQLHCISHSFCLISHSCWMWYGGGGAVSHPTGLYHILQGPNER